MVFKFQFIYQILYKPHIFKAFRLSNAQEEKREGISDKTVGNYMKKKE